MTSPFGWARSRRGIRALPVIRRGAEKPDTAAVDLSPAANRWVANLDSATNWLLATNTESASLYAGNSNVPNEIYLQDSANVEIADDQLAGHPRASNGLWLRFFDGSGATVALPDVSGPYSWKAGRGQAGYTRVDWYLEVDTASPGIGIETHAGSAVAIDGRGAAVKEVGFGIYVDPASGSAIAAALASTPYAFSNPPLNLVADYTLPALPGAAASQLTLHDVNVGALAWQVYVGGGAGAPPVTVNLGAGAFNEVAAFAGGTLNLNGSTAQFAVVEAAGPGALVYAAGADLWSQTIQADSMGRVTLSHSTVHGSSLVASNGGLLALDDETALWADGESAPPRCNLADTYLFMLAHAGTPQCNPYATAGQLPSRTVAGAGSVLAFGNSHPACPWAGTNYAPALELEAGPPVSAGAPGSLTCTAAGGAALSGTVTAYPFLLEDVQAAEIYSCTLTRGSAQMSYSVTAPSCTP